MDSSVNAILDSAMGLRLTGLMHRNDITEIYVNQDGYIWYMSADEGKVKTDLYLEPDKILSIINLVAGQVEKIVTEEIPSISAEIRGYGCRFQGEIPPIVTAPQFNIRKKATRIFVFDDYVKNGTLSAFYKEYLEQAIAARKNILVVGGTGTGKTTFLNAILDGIARISPRHRVISIEDLPELQCAAEDYSAMFTVQETNKQGIKYNMTRLLMDCMRRSPDRIIVGEVRDKAAYTMLKAWNTGHPGGACSVHANSALQGLTRIKSLAQEDPDATGDLKELIGEAIDVVVSIVHTDLGNGRRGRKVNEILEVDSFNESTQNYVYRVVTPDGGVQ
ncbi:P-type conjugative transfer ATPase TrbB [Veillonella magna]|uniref:P-type conjugative transfer ATPase TrbB n=1 Tax=Veillonella magna TaxID=464322 RepID=A0ABS2GEF8_9FIRM|nr:P-type conjugative transfer ATPase TrbB [Veillonella magna]MBM6823538.1 P-type conjugative transfer ATPase TrbB [Veillonella magna]MBM6911882.1 P-type conjugative transfer ATPase TrbB [Veillonella magna]